MYEGFALHAIFDDLISRFVVNVPDEELVNLQRISFQIEQAHWF
jgi:mRNA-decapping enzyme subunit 2